MAHTHHCEVCKAPVGICSDEGCVGPDAYGWFCPVHHPAPEHHKELIQPTKRTVVVMPPAQEK